MAFTEIDKMLIYMFKIYQATQAESYNSYENGIIIVTDKFLQTASLMSGFLALLLLLWFISLHAQKKDLSLLYGHLLLVPLMILKSNHRLVRMFKDSVEYNTK